MKLWSELEMSRYLFNYCWILVFFVFAFLKIDRYNVLCPLLFNEETISFIFPSVFHAFLREAVAIKTVFVKTTLHFTHTLF